MMTWDRIGKVVMLSLLLGCVTMYTMLLCAGAACWVVVFHVIHVYVGPANYWVPMHHVRAYVMLL